MTLYDRILVPTDGSPEGDRAVVHALDLATVHDASVHTLHVINTASYAGMPMETSWEGVDDLLRADADAAVQGVKELATDYDVDVTTAVVDGSPSREIIGYAESKNCDLIVMGTHGRGGIDRLLLGSVTEKVVRGSDIPVLTVRVSEDYATNETEAATDGSSADGQVGDSADGQVGDSADGQVGDSADGQVADSEPL